MCSFGNIIAELKSDYIAAQDAKPDGDFKGHDDASAGLEPETFKPALAGTRTFSPQPNPPALAGGCLVISTTYEQVVPIVRKPHLRPP